MVRHLHRPQLDCDTLVELAHLRASREPDAYGLRFTPDGITVNDQISYADLDRRARIIAVELGQQTRPGERALLLFQPGLDYVAAFFGCLYAGVIAIPAYPPRANRATPRLDAMVSDSSAALVLTTAKIAEQIQVKLPGESLLKTLRLLTTDNLDAPPELWRQPPITAETIAFLQYTSGSTGSPKGVLVSHGNLLHNLGHIDLRVGVREDSTGVIWLPPYHDMGLIGGILEPIFGGFPVYLMPPVAFLQQPFRWLDAMSRFRATTSSAPNFAYELCLAKISQEQRESLDLSNWDVAFNGAEAVRPETMRRFAETFQPQGFRIQTFLPCYGLAESTLIVAGAGKSAQPETRVFAASDLERGQAVVVTETDGDRTRELAGCGPPLDDTRVQVLIVNPDEHSICAPGQIGEVWVAGPSVAKGYWNQPELTRVTFDAHLANGAGPFLRTGDLGFLFEDQVYISGRIKDLIIVRGRNHHPQDIEKTAETCHPALRGGGVAAFSFNAASGEECLAIVAEVERTALRDLPVEDMAAHIRAALSAEHELAANTLIFIKPGAMPKTSSGKIQRYACRIFLDEEPSVLARVSTRAETPEAADNLAAPTPNLGGAIEIVHLLGRVSDAEARRQLLLAYLMETLGRVLGPAAQTARPDQSITALGLDSLAAVELQRHIGESLGVELALDDLLEGATLAALATLLSEKLGVSPNGGTAQPAQATEKSPDSGDFAASSGQRALWFLQQIAPASSAYNLAHAMTLSGDFDEAAFAAALQALSDRHPALRTRIVAVDGIPIQRIAARGSAIDFQVEARPEVAGQDEPNYLTEEANRPFVLDRDPPFRARLYHLGERGWVFLAVFHHVVTDFWSLTLLFADLFRLYGAARTGSAALPAPAGYFHDHVAAENTRLSGTQGEKLVRFWQEELKGAPTVLDIPTDYPRPKAQSFNGAAVAASIEAETFEKVRLLARQSGVTPFVVLFAVYQVLLSRYSGQNEIVTGTPFLGRSGRGQAEICGYFVNPLPIRTRLEPGLSFAQLVQTTGRTLRAALKHGHYPFARLVERLHPNWDVTISPIFQTMFLYQRAPRREAAALTAFASGAAGSVIRIEGLDVAPLAIECRASQFDLSLVLAPSGDIESDQRHRAVMQYNPDLFEEKTAQRLLAHYRQLLVELTSDPTRRPAEAHLLTPEERDLMLHRWNATGAPYPAEICIHECFEAQARRSPDAPALVFEDQLISYAQLDARAAELAVRLSALGAGQEVPIGVYLNRSIEMMVALMAVLKAGSAYVPLDPNYPAERIAFIVADAGMPVIVTSRDLAGTLPPTAARVLVMDAAAETIHAEAAGAIRKASAANPAYIIYTSGSTGRPKGVSVTHRSVANFFHAMDTRIGCDSGDTLLAVTSISFDISVLELFWTLARGAKVVILAEDAATAAGTQSKVPPRPVAFSLFYFAADEGESPDDKYRLLIEGAQFADQHGFAAVWTPERHFHAFGGLYPNPAITAAAVAALTRHVRIRAGSVVLPLHDPIRIAESWSMVDNLSAGRVDIAFASGWHADDFVFFPERYAGRKQFTYDGIDRVRRLWRGETIEAVGGTGKTVSLRVLPRPIQPELPVWVTTGGSPETFEEAGRLGANILTHLLGQSLDEVEANISRYRRAREEAGFESRTGQVTLMLHTFIGRDMETVRATVREPFTRYLRTSISLIANLARGLNMDFDPENISDADMNTLLDFAFERYFTTSALFGTPETAMEMVTQAARIGVDEIACLIDFGIPGNEVLDALPLLAQLREQTVATGRTRGYDLAHQAERHNPTLMQCTPSLMRMALLNPKTEEALSGLRQLLLGGEALPADFAAEVRRRIPARLVNMYGPTETTIWSACHPVETVERAGIAPIGTPIANTSIYLLDRRGLPVPVQVAGEVFIGGAGLARGYFKRPELTAARFLPDPFATRPGSRLYRTGDLARFRPDGTIEFIGRVDFQVKLRGYRIELGEIEAALCAVEGVREAVVSAREETAGDPRLVAYLVARDGAAKPGVRELRGQLRLHLPEHAVPAIFVFLDALPLTANGKVDRKALPAPDRERISPGFVAPRGRIEAEIAEIWRTALKLEKVGVQDNFFDLGGHSLLMAQVHDQIRRKFEWEVPLVKMLEHPTVAAMAKFLSQRQAESPAAGQPALVSSKDRAAKQIAARRQRPIRSVKV